MRDAICLLHVRSIIVHFRNGKKGHIARICSSKNKSLVIYLAMAKGLHTMHDECLVVLLLSKPPSFLPCICDKSHIDYNMLVSLRIVN